MNNYAENFMIDIPQTDMNTEILLHDSKAVRCWGYRRARVVPQILTIRRDAVRDIEKRFAEECGVQKDNHVVYEISCHGKSMYAWFTDSNVHIGLWIIEEGW